MTRTLRWWLAALVLVDLLFVHVTNAASPAWLLPMAGVTIASPLCAPLRRLLAYRVAWNVVVLALFAVLVQHASTAGIQYLLEDGLRLAAVSQVHLVNNLGGRQRPDLLFFNSFLIAVVTAFLTPDLAYSAVFLLHAPVFIGGLEVYCVSRSGPPQPGVLRRAALGGIFHSAVVLGVTLALFLVVPRDFQRKGLLGDRLALAGEGSSLEVGFSEDLRLERGSPAFQSDRVVMVARLRSGAAEDVPRHWRGATLGVFDGRQWHPDPSVRAGIPWERYEPGRFRRADASPRAWADVELFDPRAGRLFAPLAAVRAEVLPPTAPSRVSAAADDVLRHATSKRHRDPLRYALAFDPAVDRAEGPALPDPEGAPRSALQVPPRLPSIVPFVAQKLRDQVPATAPQHVLAERVRHHLATNYEYLPPGASGAASDVGGFLDRAGGGHCEHFATALALILRCQGVPCRVVTGYLSDEWDASGGVLTVRRRHAHAWVEVLDPEGRWYTLDASPVQSGGAAGGTSVLGYLRERLADLWDDVVLFDAQRRAAFFASLLGAPGRLAAAARARPVTVLVVGVGVAGLVALWLLGRRRREPPVVRAYRAAVRKTRVSPLPGETPRAFLRRAELAGVRRRRLDTLAAATERHERTRYRPCR